MKQSHFFCTDQDLAMFEIFPSFIELLKSLNIEIVSEDTFDFKHTYYDTFNRKLLKNGGFCRKTTYYSPTKAQQETFLYEYRKNKKSPTLRFTENSKIQRDELSKIFAVNSALIKPISYDGYNYTATITHQSQSSAYNPHLKFVIQTGSINHKYLNQTVDATFISIIDTTAKTYNNHISNSVAEKTDRIISLFNKFMSHYNLQPVSCNRYAELAKITLPESEISENINNTEATE